jgi:signal transduction histidine kinase
MGNQRFIAGAFRPNKGSLVSIRFKVILPYLLLTLFIAITGVYVVTRLVTNSLNERLTNQLLEAGRVVSDEFGQLEIDQVSNARIIAFTVGVNEALDKNNYIDLENLAKPIASGMGLNNLVIVDGNGREVLHLIRQEDKTLRRITQISGVADTPIVQDILESQNPNSLPRRAIIQDLYDGQYYYWSSLVIKNDTQVVGVIAIGTPLKQLIPFLKNTALADIIIYDPSGNVLGTTIGSQNANADFLKTLSLTGDVVNQVIYSEGNVAGEDINLEGRGYKLARSPIRIGEDKVGIFAVVLPLEFVVQPGTTSRNNYLALYTISAFAVIAIGYIVARRITKPLFALVRTSQAIAGGDLAQRTGIRSNDEIGTLANTFDSMTERLEQRTVELERANRILEQIDRTKATFIQVAAHELRTPLTVINAYAQILEKNAKTNQELVPISKGLLEGSERMSEVVNSMLDISRIDSKTLKVFPEIVHVDQMVSKVERIFNTAWEKRRLTLITKGLEELPGIYADPELLQKVFYHLIMNAIKYTPDGGTITVSGKIIWEQANTPELEVVVSDTGIGIDPQFLELIFEKFFQTGEIQFHSSGRTNFKGGGPGLGLAIVRGVVEAHGGYVWAESPGHDEEKCPGSRFIVRLPVKEMVG